jgi:hypothetical protein
MKRPKWEQEKKWSDRFIPEIKSILGQCLMRCGDIEEDAMENTDLITLILDPVRVACRVRRNKYLQYIGEFTVRAALPTGVPTELEKILDGYGDLLFYGFCDTAEQALVYWRLLDLDVFRDVYRHPLGYTGEPRTNTDRSSDFRAFRINRFPASLVVATFDDFHLGGH